MDRMDFMAFIARMAFMERMAFIAFIERMDFFIATAMAETAYQRELEVKLFALVKRTRRSNAGVNQGVHILHTSLKPNMYGRIAQDIANINAIAKDIFRRMACHIHQTSPRG